MGELVCVHRALAFVRRTERACAQALDLLAVWRGGRSSDDLTTRDAWWRAELGLSVLLGSRLGIHPRGPSPPGLCRRSRRLLLVADACVPADPPPARSLVSTRWGAGRAGTVPSARRLRIVATGPDRQCGGPTDATRHLRGPAANGVGVRVDRAPDRRRDSRTPREHGRPRL